MSSGKYKAAVRFPVARTSSDPRRRLIAEWSYLDAGGWTRYRKEYWPRFQDDGHQVLQLHNPGGDGGPWDPVLRDGAGQDKMDFRQTVNSLEAGCPWVLEDFVRAWEDFPGRLICYSGSPDAETAWTSSKRYTTLTPGIKKWLVNLCRAHVQHWRDAGADLAFDWLSGCHADSVAVALANEEVAAGRRPICELACMAHQDYLMHFEQETLWPSFNANHVDPGNNRWPQLGADNWYKTNYMVIMRNNEKDLDGPGTPPRAFRPSDVMRIRDQCAAIDPDAKLTFLWDSGVADRMREANLLNEFDLTDWWQ